MKTLVEILAIVVVAIAAVLLLGGRPADTVPIVLIGVLIYFILHITPLGAPPSE